jgi:preprotein translocase subunit SecA
MSNVAALLFGRPDAVGDGVYLERPDAKELVLEEHLRAWVARLPRLVPLARRWRKMVNLANANEPGMKKLDDAALVETFRSACTQMQRNGFRDAPVAQAFAAVREAATRTVGMRHFDVQLVGGWTLLQGRIAEMETGEGKTLVATLAACAAAAAGAAVHVVTVNDYLAARDAAQNGPLYKFMGLSVGVIKQEMPLSERRSQYACDIVYVSNKELVFDYLKDRIAAGDTVAAHLRLRQLYRPGAQPGMLLRGLHMAIVDEADSVLIDEARTPLIISETRPDELGEELYSKALHFAGRMAPAEHYDISRNNEVWINPAGEDAIGEWTSGLPGVWKSAIWRKELLQKALSALHCFHRDRQYIVVDNKVQIVDEFTGRVMPDRSWEQGLHQMIEAKEGCEITGPRKTLSRLTYQRFFRRYLLLSGMTGTATEVAPELRRVYDLDVVRIPTNKPSHRRRLPDVCLGTHEERWAAVAGRAEELSRAGRAVLVGTRSVEASERLGDLLRARGVAHTVLNARQDKSEAEAVAQAGQAGRITVATNMAGRGTDIRPPAEVLERGGLHVILTEFHESPRIDRQLSGRCARQGEPGTVEATVSLEDELFLRFAPALRRLCLKAAPAGGIVPRWLLKFLVWRVQQKAERYNRRIRLETLKQDKKLQTMLGFAGSRR